MTVQPTESILIVDFGSQVTQLIARRIRETGVYCEIAPFNAAEEAFERLGPRGIIFSGGPSSVTWEDSPRAPQVMFDGGLPLLGICYGQQTLHQQLGGKVVTSNQKEFGRAFIEIVAPSALFDGLWHVGEKHQLNAIRKAAGRALMADLAGEVTARSGEQAVRMLGDEVFQAGHRLLHALETTAAPRDRETEAEKAKRRSAERFGQKASA